ncbi:MAG: tetratricopeptide repeat-containing sulfotransferase family protein [Pseudomonadota bacterium]
MTLPPPHLSPVFARIKIGDLPGALNAAQNILRSTPRDQPLLSLAGMLACRTGDFATGVTLLKQARALDPKDQATLNNLVRAMIETGDLDAATALAAEGGDDPKLLRLSAHVHHLQGRPERAIADYRKVVAAMPDDFESWNNLGNIHASVGEVEEAIAGLQKAIELRPDISLPYCNLSQLFAKLRRFSERQALMREAQRRDPSNAEVQLETGLAEASMRDYPAAEAALREAIRLDGRSVAAYLELAVLLENLNRTDELAGLAEQARAAGLPEAETRFIDAWALRRQNRFEEALPLAQAVPETIDTVRRCQLLGEVADRVGEADIAFSAFRQMNAASLELMPIVLRDADVYLDEVRANTDQLSAEATNRWTRTSAPSEPPSPIFLVGFPRSGTTLLDTLLMNLPQLHVLEEMPVVRQVENALGAPSEIASLDDERVAELRRLYFETLDQIAPPAAGQRVVDKFPLHMTRMGIIHRLFPDAKVIFAERHPCDCVLSAFMSNFELNRAMLSFTTLEGAARLYDLAQTAWTLAEANLPIDVHRIRYERMVENPEAEMRALLAFLDVPWDERVLDNRGSAAKRDHIRTASYSQVTEPIYRRSAGRWERYRSHLEPVLPILAPWANSMGYTI